MKETIWKREIGVDLKIPSEDGVVPSLRIVEKVDLLKRRVAFNLAFDSALRLTETVKLIDSFKADAVEKVGDSVLLARECSESRKRLTTVSLLYTQCGC